MMILRTDIKTWFLPDGEPAFEAEYWESPGWIEDDINVVTGEPIYLIIRKEDGAVFTPWDLFH